MTQQLEAMKLALEALIDGDHWEKQEAITTLRQAIEQAQKQAPCDMGELCIGCSPRNADGSCPDAQKQEPVAYRYMDKTEPELGFWFDEEPSDLSYLHCEPLYTSPPQRQPLVIDSQEKASEYIEKTLWEVIDVAAMFPKAKPDPRTWEHLMVYAPQRPPLTDEQLQKAAMKLADCMNYPWEYITKEGQQRFKDHAKAIIETAIGIKGEA